MASRPTANPKEGIGADSTSTEGEGDKGRRKEGKTSARIIMNSKVVQKVSGKKRYSGGVTPAPENLQPPAYVKASTPKRSSDPKHHPQSGATGKSHKKDSSASGGEHQQQWDSYTMPAPPRQDQHQAPTSLPTEQAFERQRPTTSPHPTHAPAEMVIQDQPRPSSHLQQQLLQPLPVGVSIMYDHLQVNTAQVGN